MPALAVAQASPSAAAPPASTAQPLLGASDYLPEIQVLVDRRAVDGQVYRLDERELERAFPGVMPDTSTGAEPDPAQVVALLFAITKDLREHQLYLGAQMEHLLGEKAELERKVHDLEARVAAAPPAGPTVTPARPAARN